MTRALKETTAYVNCCIEDMNGSIEWAKKITKHDKQWSRQWALGRINDEYKQAFGALQLAFIYLGEIEQEDRDALTEKLREAKNKAEDRVWKEI